MLVFGGQNFASDRSTDEFFQLDGKALTIVGGSRLPKPRNSHTLTSAAGRLVLFGGANEDGPLGDCFIYKDGWSKLEIEGDHLVPREMHTAHYLATKVPLEAFRSTVTGQQQSQ